MIIVQKHLEFYLQYCRDTPALAADNTITNFTENNAITDSFKIKERITGETGNDGTKNVEIMVPLSNSK